MPSADSAIAKSDTRCFLPVHVYRVESGKPVVVFLRSEHLGLQSPRFERFVRGGG